MSAPLDGILVVDFSQFLSGPYASLQLMDLGARVIKVENPNGGDLCRKHYVSETQIDGDSTIFHAINRGKQSIALDLKAEVDLAKARRLIAKADIVIQNFRPGVVERLGLAYESAKKIRPDIIYGSISGYGEMGDWSEAPGQDLLAQARSGVMWLSGNAGNGPVPIGIPIADITAGANLAQGILGALFHHARTGQGTFVQTSLLEALIDLQFEFLTTYCNNGATPPQRLERGSAHGYLASPYGVYRTQEGHLALAMTPLPKLAQALDAPTMFDGFEGTLASFHSRDALFRIIEARLRSRPAADWDRALGAAGIWCAKVLDWPEVLASDAVQSLDMRARVAGEFEVFRSPIRMNGRRPDAHSIAPRLNAQAEDICREFDL